MASYPMGEEIPGSGERKPLRTRQIVSRDHLAAVVAWLDENGIEDGDFAIDLHLRLSETTARRYLASQPGGLLRNEQE